MKLKEGFITHQSGGEHITVAAGVEAFNGTIRSNSTAGFIVDCLKEQVTREEIVDKMLERYDASKEQITKDVERVLGQLKAIGALDD